MTEDHFVLASGMHSGTYVNKDAVYPHTVATSRLCCAIAERFADDGVEVVIAPEKGGIILSQWVAYHLSIITGREVLAIYAEKEMVAISGPGGMGRACFLETGNFVIRRGYDRLLLTQLALVVEDVLTTGASAVRTIEATMACGAYLAGLGVLCNRGGLTSRQMGVPELFSLVDLPLDAWDEATCPLCKQGVPINTDVGKGRDFLARRASAR
ncbi:MAG: phosphoribosyltransferase [Nanoarchaeota archaeon]|nr:phosphoribosyltransferase [Nanoarchaeota archaeon]